MTSYQRMILAVRLSLRGYKVECARKRLQKGYQIGKGNDSKRMKHLRDNFNKQCNRFLALENALQEESEE